MTVVLIGSRALALRAPQALKRKPVDFDLVCGSVDETETWLQQHNVEVVKRYERGNKLIVEGQTPIEVEIATPNTSTALLLEIVDADPQTKRTSLGLVPSLDMLFTLKKSHRHLKDSPHFWKTLTDYHMIKRLGARIRPEYADFLTMRERETYAYKHPKLNQGKMSFFAGDGVHYVWDHDSIHRAVAIYDVPAYTRFQKDGAEVQVDREKWNALDRKHQLASVVEEASVLAIERSLVPHPGKLTPEQAWRYAFSKVLTSITSGWWRDAAYENALDVLQLYRQIGVDWYWQSFQEGVAAGNVVPHGGEKL